MDADPADEYVRTRNPELRTRIILDHQWLVEQRAQQMRRHEPIEELIQVANVGLLEALDRYDPANGAMFRTYARATIDGVLRHHYRDAWYLRVARPVQDLHLRVGPAVEKLAAELGRQPTVAEIAALTGVSPAEVAEAVDAGINFTPLSLSYEDMGRADELARSESIDERLDLEALLDRLPELKRRIVVAWFFEERTQTEIGELVGLTQIQVSRLMRQALRQLRTYGHRAS